MATVTINGAVSVKGNVTINGDVQSDTELTGDMTAADLLTGKTGYADDANTKITGTCPYNADTSDATMAAGDLVSPKTGYGSAGTKITGTLERVWPEVLSASYYNDVNGVVVIILDHYMSDPGAYYAQFSVEADSVPMAISSAFMFEPDVLVLGLTTAFSSPTLVTVSYTKGNVTDTHGIPLQSFSNVECAVD